MNSVFLSRCFSYFQQGYNLLSFPMSLISFATVIYYLLIDHFAILKVIFPAFTYFILIGAIIFIPLSSGIGWFYTKRSRVFGSQQVLMTEVNPLTVHSSRLQMEQQMEILKALQLEPSAEYVRLTEFWQRLDDAKRWRP